MTDTDNYADSLIDEDRLISFLTNELGPVDEFHFERHGHGHSNETIFFTWGVREYVLRRPPAGEVAETAHDVLREHFVLSKLQNTNIPVPEVVVATDDRSIIGSDFFVMEHLHGDVFRLDAPDFESEAKRQTVGYELVDTLVAIHSLDYGSVGLGEYGRPTGFTERQVRRWGKQLDWAFSVTRKHRSVPLLEEIGEWLVRNIPEQRHETLVHGDYKLDNVMFDRTNEPRIIGVFDWELSTLGDPFTDLGWMLLFWWDESQPEPSIPELMPRFTERTGYPTKRELVERYERKLGCRIENDRFYRVLAAYKLAGLCEMFYARYLQGNSDDPLYPLMDKRVPALAKRAENIIDGNEPI